MPRILNLEPLQRHPTLYFDEPGTLVFKVRHVLFRPHVFLLRRYCHLFRDMLAIEGPAVGEGSSDDNPIELVDVRLADGHYRDITPEGFEVAVRSMYPDMMYDNPPSGEHQWILVLDASYRWQSSYLRHIALDNLSKLEVDASTRLKLATKYQIDGWMHEIYITLCRRRKPIGESELALMSPRHGAELKEARNRLVRIVCHDLLVDCAMRDFACAGARMAHTRRLLEGTPWTQHDSWVDIIDEGSRGQKNDGWCWECIRAREKCATEWAARVRKMTEEIINPPAQVYQEPLPKETNGEI